MSKDGNGCESSKLWKNQLVSDCSKCLATSLLHSQIIHPGDAFLLQTVPKAVSAREHKNTKRISGGHAPRSPKRCREQLIKCNSKCCPPTFHDLPTPLLIEVVSEYINTQGHIPETNCTGRSFVGVVTTPPKPIPCDRLCEVKREL